MNALLIALINISQRTGRFTVAQATDFYNRLWLLFVFVLTACTIAFAINAKYGLLWPSLVLAIAFAVAAIFLWAKPLHILIVGGLGLLNRIIGDPTLADEVGKALTTYLELLKWVLLVAITFLFIIGTVSFQAHPGSILPILVGLAVIGLFTWAWPSLFAGKWGRRIVYGYAVAIVVFSFVSLIHGSVWVKYTGWDPFTVAPTKTDAALYALNQTERELADAERAAELERIKGNVERGETLSEADRQFVRSAEAATTVRIPDDESGVLTMKPYGKSKLIRSPMGYGVAYDGEGFEAYYGYADGVEVNTKDPMPADKKGVEIIYGYTKDTSGRPNTATYEFVRW